jgi:hypothetical protein
MDRIRKLEILANLWGNLYLFHPNVVRSDLEINWDQVLIEAIPKIEKTKSMEDFVSSLNEWLFKPLDDPLSYVCQTNPSNKKKRLHPGKQIEARKLSPSTGLITVPHPFQIRNPNFPGQFASAIDLVSGTDLIIVDLRWEVTENTPYGFEPLISFFITETLSAAHVVTRVHHGWSQHNDHHEYAQKWEITVGNTIRPINQPYGFMKYIYPDTDFKKLEPVCIPTVFLLNNSSYSALANLIAAPQSLPHIAVIWERTGPSGNLGWASSLNPLIFDEGITAHINQAVLLSSRDLKIFNPDYQVPVEIGLGELENIASKLVKEKMEKEVDLVNRFPFEMKLGAPDPESSGLVSREERLLGLFRIWTVIDRFFLFLEYALIDWSSMLREAIPSIEDANSIKEYYSRLQGIAAKLCDSHIHVWHPELQPGEYTIPFRLARFGQRLFAAEKIDGFGDGELNLGDEILEIEGMPIEAFEEQWRSRISASTDQAFYRRLYNQRGLGSISSAEMPFRGEQGSTIRFTIKRGKQTFGTDVTRSIQSTLWDENLDSGDPYKKLENNLGYINLTTVASLEEIDSALGALKDTDGLILDLRGYPKFWLTLELVSRLCRHPVRSTVFEIPIVSSFDPAQETLNRIQYIVQPHSTVSYEKPVVVLINERVQSMPEDLCIYLRNAERVIFIGTPTTGTNGDVTLIHLPAGGDMTFTGMRATYGDGSRFQNIGIIPDVEVHPSLENVMNGVDEILEQGKVTLLDLL